MSCTVNTLPPPARYFPLDSGRYEIRAGLSRLGTDFGNGAHDARVFQLDARFADYRRQKLDARAEDLDKYHPPGPLRPRAAAAVQGLIATRLAAEHAESFSLRTEGGGAILDCALTGERLRFAADWSYQGVDAAAEPAPPYRDGLDALACQVQEDLAVVQMDSNGADRLAAVHLCFPNHWAARDKIDRDFVTVHRPVAGIEPISRNAGKLVRTMIDKGPFVRFAWGLATDDRLNHHPLPPPDADPETWRGRRFDPANPRLYLRIERQVTLGLPEVGCALFTIRTYFLDVAELRREAARNRALQSALGSMRADSLRYKGLAESREAILAWLRAGA